MTGNIQETLTLNDAFTPAMQSFINMAGNASRSMGQLNSQAGVLFGPNGQVVWKDMGRAAEDAGKKIQKAGESSSGFFKQLIGAGVLMRGYQMLNGMLREGIQAALQAEMVNVALIEGMRRLNDSADPSKVLAYYESLAKASGTSDEAMKQAATDLQRMAGLSQGAVAEMMKGMLGTALSKGQRDAGLVAQAIGTALTTGSARALKDFGIQIEEGLSMDEQLDSLVAQLRTFEAQVDQAAATASGRAYAVADAWGEAKEAMGKGFLDSFKGSTEAIDALGQSLHGIGVGIAWVVRGVSGAFLILSSGMTTLISMWTTTFETMLNIFDTVVDGITSGWDFIKTSFESMWKGLLEYMAKGWNKIADSKLGRKMGLGLIDVGELEKESEDAGRRARQSFSRGVSELGANAGQTVAGVKDGLGAGLEAGSNQMLQGLATWGLGTLPAPSLSEKPESDKTVLADMRQRDDAATKMKDAGGKMKDAAEAFGRGVESMFGGGGTKASQETAERYQRRAQQALRHGDYESYGKYSEIAGRAQYGSNYDMMRERGMIEDPQQKARDIANYMDFGVTPDEKQGGSEGKKGKGGKSGGKGDGGIGEAVDKAEGKLDAILPKLARFIEEIPERLESIETALQAAGITG